MTGTMKINIKDGDDVNDDDHNCVRIAINVDQECNDMLKEFQ